MPRLNTGQEVFSRLTSMTKYVLVTATPFSETVTAAIAVDDATFTVAGITNATAADPVIINGDGGTELVILGTPATTMPVATPFVVAQSSGATAREAVAIPVGHVEEGGVTFGGTLTLNPVNAATATTPITYLASTAELTFSFSLLGMNVLNFQSAFGATESEIGAGTAADPWAGQVGLANVGTQTITVWRAMGTRVDGAIVQVDFCDAVVEVNVSATIGQATTPASLPHSLKCTNIVLKHWT